MQNAEHMVMLSATELTHMLALCCLTMCPHLLACNETCNNCASLPSIPCSVGDIDLLSVPACADCIDDTFPVPHPHLVKHVVCAAQGHQGQNMREEGHAFFVLHQMKDHVSLKSAQDNASHHSRWHHEA